MYIDILCGFSSNTRRNNNVCLVLFFFFCRLSLHICIDCHRSDNVHYVPYVALIFFDAAAAAVVVVIVILVNISEKKVDRLPQDECQEIDAIYKQSFWFFSRLFRMN